MVYVDNLNITKTYEELLKTIEILKNDFEMKGLKIQSFVLTYRLNI